MEQSRLPRANEIGAIARQLVEIAQMLRGEPPPPHPSSGPAHRGSPAENSAHGVSDKRDQPGAAPTASARQGDDRSAGPQSDRPINESIDFLDLARKTYADRRRRDALFADSQIFGEPAWDILLDLYIAGAEGQSVSVSSACIGSAAPATTGLRWLGILEHNGLVARRADPRDQRRVLVSLTEHGITTMEQYFEQTGA